VKVTTVINIDLDIQEVPANIAEEGMSSMKRKRFTCTKALLVRDDKTYSDVTCHRSFASQFVPTTQYDTIQFLNTLNYNTTKKILIRDHIAQFTEQANYNSLRYDSQSNDAWFVQLLPSTDIAKEPTELPVTTFNVTVRYLVRYNGGFIVNQE